MTSTPIFISWSGPKSKAVADIWRHYLPQVLQATAPFFTPTDVEKGREWWTTISTRLRASKGMGLFFLTKKNLDSRWLNFEAGAIAAFGGDGGVCTVLVDADVTEVGYPLNAFQHTKLDRKDVLQLMFAINDRLEAPCEKDVVNEVFGRTWPEMETHIAAALDAKYDDEATHGNASATPREDLAEALTRIENSVGALGLRFQSELRQATNHLVHQNRQLAYQLHEMRFGVVNGILPDVTPFNLNRLVGGGTVASGVVPGVLTSGMIPGLAPDPTDSLVPSMFNPNAVSGDGKDAKK